MRSRVAALRPAGLVLGVALALALAGCGTGRPSSAGGAGGVAGPSAPGRSVGTSTNIALPAAVAHLRLRDSTGRVRTLASFRGKVLVVSDSMTLCQETCPLDTSSLVQTARDVDRSGLGDKVVLLTITVDPKRDTPAQLAAYRRLFAPPPANWLALTGSAAELDQLWKTLGVYRKVVSEHSGTPPRNWRTGAPLTYDVQHSDEVFFFDADLHERFILDGAPHVSGKGAIPKRLYQFMSKHGHRNVLHPDSEAWTVPQALQAIGWLTHHQIRS